MAGRLASVSGAANFLVVDDHAAFRSALARALGKYGAVKYAGTVLEGKELIVREPWAAVFIDVTLPDGNGLDVLEFARTHGCVAPVLVLTVSDDPQTIHRAGEHGAKFAVKPGDWREIDAFVRGALPP